MACSALVIGGQGVLGTFIARALSNAGWQVTRAGRRPEAAADFRVVDLDDARDLSQACAEADLVVNTAHHDALSPERTVLRQGGTMLDLIELTQPERGQLSRENGDDRGLVAVDTGLGGVAYLAIAELLREHPDADAAEYSLMVSAKGSSGRAGALLGYCLLTGASHHETTPVPFPPPFGQRRCPEVGADGESMLRQEVGEVPICHYICMEPRRLHGTLLALNKARLISLIPKFAFTAGTGTVPSEPSDELICEWVAVSRGGERLAMRTVAGRGYYRMTAAATLAFAEALMRRDAPGRPAVGLRSIDEVITLADVWPTLEERGVTVSEPLVAAVGRA